MLVDNIIIIIIVLVVLVHSLTNLVGCQKPKCKWVFSTFIRFVS